MSGINFGQGVVCDDIRQENNGKIIIIGMYTGAYVPSRLPAATQLAFGVWGTVDSPGTYKCRFELCLEPDGLPVGTIELEFQTAEDEKDFFLPLPKFPVNIGTPGYIVLNEKNTAQEVIRLKIASPPSASLLPSGQAQSDVQLKEP